MRECQAARLADSRKFFVDLGSFEQNGTDAVKRLQSQLGRSLQQQGDMRVELDKAQKRLAQLESELLTCQSELKSVVKVSTGELKDPLTLLHAASLAAERSRVPPSAETLLADGDSLIATGTVVYRDTDEYGINIVPSHLAFASAEQVRGGGRHAIILQLFS
jgi:hypothetical protein